MAEEKKSSPAASSVSPTDVGRTTDVKKAMEDKTKWAEKNQSAKNSNKAADSKQAPVKQGIQAKKKVFKGRRSGFKNRTGKPQEEFEQRIIDIARVTRVMAGGKRMRFRVCIAIGDKRGRVAIGLAKGKDVAIAVTKSVNKAKKNFITVPIVNSTIPHEVYQKFGAAKVLFKPARKGRGIIAGGAVRIVLELAGIKNVTSKILGTNNKVNNVKCTIEALRNLKKVEGKKSSFVTSSAKTIEAKPSFIKITEDKEATEDKDKKDK